MATEVQGIDTSFPAAEDLSSDQFRVVILTSDGTVRRPDAITDIPIGILQNAPASGEAASVRLLGCGGISKVVLGGTIATGAVVACEYASATDAGKVQAVAQTQYPVGILTKGGAEDELGSVLLAPVTVKA